MAYPVLGQYYGKMYSSLQWCLLCWHSYKTPTKTCAFKKVGVKSYCQKWVQLSLRISSIEGVTKHLPQSTLQIIRLFSWSLYFRLWKKNFFLGIRNRTRKSCFWTSISSKMVMYCIYFSLCLLKVHPGGLFTCPRLWMSP